MPRNANETPVSEELLRVIGDRYLLLIRENYLDESFPEELTTVLFDSLKQLLHAGRFTCVRELAESQNWRESVVGLHYAVMILSPAFDFSRPKRPAPAAPRILVQRICKLYQERLAEPNFVASLLARPTVLLFTVAERWDGIDLLMDPDKYDPDASDVYAAVTAAEQFRTRPSRATGAGKLLARLRTEPWHDEQDFEDSKLRFVRAVNFWWGAPFVPSG